MIVYAETNFLLELAFQQEEREACERILELATEGRIQLVVPVFCIVESYSSLSSRHRDRERFHGELDDRLTELARSRHHAERIAESRGVASVFLEANDDEAARLAEVTARIRDYAETIDLTDAVVLDSRVQVATRGLSVKDSVVYSSILAHLVREESHGPRIFLGRDTKAFMTPEIGTELADRGCRVIPRFEDGLGAVEAVLRE